MSHHEAQHARIVALEQAINRLTLQLAGKDERIDELERAAEVRRATTCCGAAITRPTGCRCHQEEGDSPCPVHPPGAEEQAYAAACGAPSNTPHDEAPMTSAWDPVEGARLVEQARAAEREWTVETFQSGDTTPSAYIDGWNEALEEHARPLADQIEAAAAEIERLTAERDAYRAMVVDLLASAHPNERDQPSMSRQWARALELLTNGTATLAPPITCSTCDDTHMMARGDGEAPCRRCPLPCSSCAGTASGAYCAMTPCTCDCHAEMP